MTSNPWSHHWWRFRIPAALMTALFAVWGALLPSNASTPERIALAVGGTLGGALVLGGIAFLSLFITAPLRQRNEVRKAFGQLRSSHDAESQELVGRFSAWVQATKATMPKYPSFGGPLVLWNEEAHEKRQVDHSAALQRYSEAKDEVERRARREYHDQFREPLAKLRVGPLAERMDNPRTIQDFEEIEREVVSYLASSSGGPPPEEAVSRVLRRVRGLLLNELRINRGVISAALERKTYWQNDRGLQRECWDQVGSDLAEHGSSDVHEAVSAAYARMDALNEDSLNTWRAMEAHYGYDPPPGRPPTIKGNESALEAAMDSIASAEGALAQTAPSASSA